MLQRNGKPRQSLDDLHEWKRVWDLRSLKEAEFQRRDSYTEKVLYKYEESSLESLAGVLISICA